MEEKGEEGTGTGTAARRMERCREEKKNGDRYPGAMLPIDLPVK